MDQSYNILVSLPAFFLLFHFLVGLQSGSSTGIFRFGRLVGSCPRGGVPGKTGGWVALDSMSMNRHGRHRCRGQVQRTGIQVCRYAREGVSARRVKGVS